MAFLFHTQYAQSLGGVSQVVQWMRQASTGFWGLTALDEVTDVQDNPADYYKGDIMFAIGGRQRYVEVKVESRSSASTPNMAIERWSRPGKPGGPWSTSATYYGHIYGCGLFCVMLTAELRYFIDRYSAGLRSFNARNPGYISSGILLPRNVARGNIRSYTQWGLDKA